MESNNSIVSGFDNDKDDSLKITLHKIPGVENSCMVVLEESVCFQIIFHVVKQVIVLAGQFLIMLGNEGDVPLLGCRLMFFCQTGEVLRADAGRHALQ